MQSPTLSTAFESKTYSLGTAKTEDSGIADMQNEMEAPPPLPSTPERQQNPVP